MAAKTKGIMNMLKAEKDIEILAALIELHADTAPVDLYTLAERLSVPYGTLYYRLHGDSRKGVAGLADRTECLAFVPMDRGDGKPKQGIMLTKQPESDQPITPDALNPKREGRLTFEEIETIEENLRMKRAFKMDEKVTAEWNRYKKLCAHDLGDRYPFKTIDEQERKWRVYGRDQNIIMALRRLKADVTPTPLTALATTVNMSEQLLTKWIFGDERHEALTARNQNVRAEPEGIRLIR